MEVNGYGTTSKFEIFIEKGAVFVGGVPTIIEGGIIHRVIGGEGLFIPINHGGDSSGAVHFGNTLQPLIACGVSRSLFGEIEITHTPEATGFCSNGIVNHTFANCVVGAINAANK